MSGPLYLTDEERDVVCLALDAFIHDRSDLIGKWWETFSEEDAGMFLTQQSLARYLRTVLDRRAGD